jgi:hypothetical protein
MITRLSRSSRSFRTGKAEDRHHLGRDCDVEAFLAPQPLTGDIHRQVAQRTVVHIECAAPGDRIGIEVERIAPIELIVDHRGEQIVRRGHGMEVAGEMQIDLDRGCHLRPAAARSATLHAKARTQRRLAQADEGPLADPGQPVAQPDRGRRLALARRRRADRGHQDQLAASLARQGFGELAGQLRLVRTIVIEGVARDTDTHGDVIDRKQGHSSQLSF